MNAAQFLEFLMGSKYGSKFTSNQLTAQQVDSYRKEFLESAQKGIRDQIEVTLPLVYLVRPYDIAAFNMQGLIDQSNALSQMASEVSKISATDKQYTKANIALGKKKNAVADFISSINIGGTSYVPGDPEYHEALPQIINSVDINALGKAIMDALYSSTKFKDPITLAQLGDVAAKTVSYLAVGDSRLAKIAHRGRADPSVAKLESLVRSRIHKIAALQKAWLEVNTPARISDAAKILNNYSESTDFLFVSAKFKSDSQGARDIPNQASKDLIMAALKKAVSVKIGNRNQTAIAEISKNYSVGAFAAAGHTGVVSQDDPTQVKEVVGGNFPLLQQTLLFATEQKDAKNIGKISSVSFINNTEHINLSLNFKKGDPANFAKTLLSANFSFAFTQQSAYNSQVLSPQEVAEMDRQVDAAFKLTYKELGNQFKAAFFSAEGIRNLISYLKFSPTVKEGITRVLKNTLEGIVPKSLGNPVASAFHKGMGSKPPNISLSKGSKSSKISVNRSSSGKTKAKAKGYIPTEPAVNTLSLMTLINSQLQDVISANMGSGTSRNVLNYRTGRFASSAKVESLSISRQGTITAFYSYMKNPYATFSSGGRQSAPKTRDPKLLISKSIREIAQQAVSNNLRAVAL